MIVIAVFESPALVAGLDDVAVVGEPVEERGGHLGVAEDDGPFAEREIGGDDDGGALVEPADEVEEELAAGLSERHLRQYEDRGGDDLRRQRASLQSPLHAPRLRFKTLDELNAWLLDKCIAYAKGIAIRNCPNRRSGRCSKPERPSSFPMLAGSMDSTRCRHRSRRPAWYASTTTNTRSQPMQSGVRSRFMPMPTAS